MRLLPLACLSLAVAVAATSESQPARPGGGLVWATPGGTVQAELRLERSAGVIGLAQNHRGLWVAGVTADGVPDVLSSGTWLARVSGPGQLADEQVVETGRGVRLPVSLAAAPGGALVVGGEVAGDDLALQRYSANGAFDGLTAVRLPGIERGGTVVPGPRDGLLLGGQDGARGWFARLAADGTLQSSHEVPGAPPVRATAGIGRADGAFILAGTEGGAETPARVWSRRIEATGESWVTTLPRERRPDRGLYEAMLVELDGGRVLLVSNTTARPGPSRRFADWRVWVAVIDAEGRVEFEAVGAAPLMARAAASAGGGRVWIAGEASEGRRRMGAAVDFDVAGRRFGTRLALPFLSTARAVHVHGPHLVVGGVAAGGPRPAP